MWFSLALATAFFASLNDLFAKKFFSHLSYYEMAVYPMVYSFPFFLAALLAVEVPLLDRLFFFSFAASLPINTLGFILYMKAIKISPLSLTVPYLAFTPAFMIVTGYLFLGETPGISGIIGILLIVVGGYVLNLDLNNFSFLSPFFAVTKEKGSLIMLFVAFIFSFAAAVGKVGILHSSPLYFSVSFFLVFTVFIVSILLIFRKISLRNLMRYRTKGLIAGAAMFLHILFHGIAISLTKAAYMMAIKRLSIVFSVLYGGILFKETNLGTRLAGAFLMLMGSAMILAGS